MLNLDELLKIADNYREMMTDEGLERDMVIHHTSYKIKRILYRGDFTFTYLVEDYTLQRQYVIKEYFPKGLLTSGEVTFTLKREGNKVVIENSNPMKEAAFVELKAGFKENAEILIGISQHRNLVQTLDVVEANNTYYMVLGHVPFPTLAMVLKQKLLKPKEAMYIYYQILEAVKQLHDGGFVHKHLKPGNIYIGDSHVILGDFQVKNRLSLKQPCALYAQDGFMAPEYKGYEEADTAADIFSLGQLLNHLLEHVGYRYGTHQSVDLGGQLDVDRLSNILEDATMPDVNQRIQTVEDLAGVCRPAVINKKRQALILRWLIAGLLVILALVLLVKIVDLPLVDSDESQEKVLWQGTVEE